MVLNATNDFRHHSIILHNMNNFDDLLNITFNSFIK